MEITKKVELEKAIISLLKDDVIKIDIKEYSIIDIDDIKKFQEAKKSLIGNAKHFVLFISPKIGTLTKEAREYSASPEVNLNAKAKAVVVPNLAARLVANFFIKTNKPPIIHKAFVNEKEALIWLRTIKLN